MVANLMQAKKPNYLTRAARQTGQLHGQDRRDYNTAVAAGTGAQFKKQFQASAAPAQRALLGSGQGGSQSASATGGGVKAPTDNGAAISHLEQNIKKFGAANRPNDVKRLAALKAAGTPAAPTAPAAPAAPPTGDIIENGMGDESSSRGDNGMGNAFFPSQQAFEQQNYEGSPMYKWQQQEGQTALNRVLSKRGLLNSGAEIEANNRFQGALAAGESDKARGYAQNEADRYERMSQQEANRRQQNQNSASDNAYRWTQMLLNQNPMQYASHGTDQYASTVGKEANSMANYLGQLYTRASGGGGGGGPGPFQPPFPSNPDFSGIDQIGAITNGNNNNNIANSIINSLPGFFDPKNWG